MPTHQDEALPQRYAREHQDYLKLCGSMTAEQVADIQLQLHNSLAREQALQQRLTAADERADMATSLIQRIVANFDTEIECHEDVEPNDFEHDQVLTDMRVFLAALKPAESSGKPCACPGCDSERRANSPFCAAHRSAKSRTRGQDPLTAEGLEWLMQNDGLQQ